MRTVKMRAFPVCFVCCGALLVGCSDAATTLPNNNATAGTSNGTSGSSSSAGTMSSAGSTATATAGSAAGGSAAGTGTTTGGSGDSGGAAVAGSAGSGGSAEVVDFSRPKGQLPNIARDPANVDVPRADWKKDLVSPSMNEMHHHNQPTVLNGYLNLNGNEEFWFWDITDPTKPKQMTQYLTPNRDPMGGGKSEGEAESHCVSYGRYGSTFYEVTTGGHGVDIWDVTDQAKVTHISQIKLEGIDYGDFTAAVWGLSWQGNYIYVGGTDTGLHILDAHDPLNVKVVKRLPTSNFGTVSAGPLDAIGNMLVIMTPKGSAGIATMDISDPLNPVYLTSIKPSKESYITQFYRHFAFMQMPLRSWDVLSDPTNIGGAETPLSSTETPGSEYLSFGDDNLFLGRLRSAAGGATVYDVTDPTKGMPLKSTVWGRLDTTFNDDQFTIMIGNLLVLGDDQEPYRGSVIAQWAAAPDTTPPKVDTIIPRDKATGQNVKSRIGISFTDNIEFVTVNEASLIVRPVGGAPIKGVWGSRMGVVNFSPIEDLKPATTYEVILPKGGITDLVLNGIAEDFKSTFTTK
jgi:Bacterial Ig-like domain/LVIVD repeat